MDGGEWRGSKGRVFRSKREGEGRVVVEAPKDRSMVARQKGEMERAGGVICKGQREG